MAQEEEQALAATFQHDVVDTKVTNHPCFHFESLD